MSSGGDAPEGMSKDMMGNDLYEVTITNLTTGQPLSPPLLATHAASMHAWQPGGMASPALRTLAEEGMNDELAGVLRAKGATDVRPTGEMDHVMPGKSLTLRITAKPGDVLTVLAMVAATNDGFTGVDGMALPAGKQTADAVAYDAGTEQNTEKTSDTAAPAMGKGHVPTIPQAAIAPHAGIRGTGDLEVAKYGWTGPVARIVVTKL